MNNSTVQYDSTWAIYDLHTLAEGRILTTSVLDTYILIENTPYTETSFVVNPRLTGILSIIQRIKVPIYKNICECFSLLSSLEGIMLQWLITVGLLCSDEKIEVTVSLRNLCYKSKHLISILSSSCVNC